MKQFTTAKAILQRYQVAQRNIAAAAGKSDIRVRILLSPQGEVGVGDPPRWLVTAIITCLQRARATAAEIAEVVRDIIAGTISAKGSDSNDEDG